MRSVNGTNNTNDPYPWWYFVNDCLTIVGNTAGIFIAGLFIVTVIRVDYPSYSKSNLIVCNSCLAIGLTSSTMLFGAAYALTRDLRGIGIDEPLCVMRGRAQTVFTLYMYTSLCLKAFNRLRCIVFYRRPWLRSYRTLAVVVLVQWSTIVVVSSLVLDTDVIVYNSNSHSCLLTIGKTRDLIVISTCRSCPIGLVVHIECMSLVLFV
jgi:hypothetical protein